MAQPSSLACTVLGSSGSHTGPGQACSGYLVTSGGTQVLVDAGNGSTANLQLTTAFDALDAVVISHRHADHCVDLVGMFYALRFHPDEPRGLPLYAGADVVDTVLSLLGTESRDAFGEIFAVAEVGGADRFDVGPLQFTLFPSVHPVPTVSMRVEADGRVLAYSADSAGGDDLVACARDADLFLCEATWRGHAQDWPDGVHLTARGAGEVATRAGARRLALTHIAGASEKERSRAEAEDTYGGEVLVVADRDVLTVERPDAAG